jgi:hypothetical protein
MHNPPADAPRHPVASHSDLDSDLDGLAHGDARTPDHFPRLFNISAGFMYKRMLRPLAIEQPEFITIPYDTCAGLSLEMAVAIAEWNSLLEAAQYRRRMIRDERRMPDVLYRIADRGDYNVMFVPRTRSRYYEYASLYHLLPGSVLERNALPLLRAGQWPFQTEWPLIEDPLPIDFATRLANAWGSVIWPRLMPGLRAAAFTRDDPIRILAHDLDYWLPPVTGVLHDILQTFPLVGGAVEESRGVTLNDGVVLRDVRLGAPRMGGDLWRGVTEANEVIDWIVEKADNNGSLRALLDAIRSHRVEDDFSTYWSRAREDFERKLNHKRARISVRFVELPETISVQGPEKEVIDKTILGDFLALLDRREREVVLLLSKGVTRVGDVAAELGYANHSTISKRLVRIRRKAEAYFDEI